MVRIIAHRGASSAYPENSLAAFRHAVAAGTDALEVDLRRSADGVIYCFHDHHLSRLTGQAGYLQRTNSKQLDHLLLLKSEPPLRFENFLEEFGGRVQIVLDIKSTDIERDILRLCLRVAKKADLIYSSFNQRILARIKSLQPHARTALILGPMRNLKIKLDIGSYLVGRLTRLDCAAAHLSVRIARPRLVSKLASAGFVVAVWTVDDADLATKVAGFGVDGVITNVPEDLVPKRDRIDSAAL